MAALEDVEVLANLFRLSGTGTIHSVDELKDRARDLMPEVETDQMARAIRGLANKLWDANYGGFRNEYLRSRGRTRAAPQQILIKSA